MDATAQTHENPTGTHDDSGGAADDLDEDVEDEHTPRRNLIERLRQRRESLAEEHDSGERTLTLPIPGYGNDLFIVFTYRPDAFDRMKKIGNRALRSRHPRKELYAAMDTLAYACTDVRVPPEDWDGDDETLEPFDESGEPTKFDEVFAGAMDIAPPPSGKLTVRHIISKTFNNDLAITSMSNRVSEWMQGEDEDSDEDFGES